MTGGCVGESVTQRGEDVVKDEGKQSGGYDLPPQGQSQRPAGGSRSRSLTGVDPGKQSPRIPQRTELAEPSDCWSGPQLSGAAETPYPRDG
jgi:hypothetical protein